MAIYDVNGKPLATDVTNYDIPIITGELPVVFIESETAYTSLTKETASDATLTFVDWKKKFELAIKVKLQGNNSLYYEKKNLNFTFYNGDGKKQKIIFNDWYPTNKIHLKANWYDVSMCRNSVATRLAYHFMGKLLPNGAVGYIDSFPCLLYYNGEYMGCHTFNLPQDGKTYNFKDSAEKALQNLAYRCSATRNTSTNKWTLSGMWEYRGDEDETAEMRAVFDSLLSIMTDTTNLSKAIIEEHFDVQTLLGYLVFAQISCAVDSLTNNWTIVTWDGTKWYHVWYDLDICYGIGGNDGTTISATKDVFTSLQGGYNAFFAKVKELYSTELAEMYAEFRRNGADVDSISNAFRDFKSKWGWQNVKADRDKWGDALTSVDIDAIPAWLTSRFAYLDNLYGYTS